MQRTAKNPQVRIEHPRYSAPSIVSLWATLDGKREDVVVIDMTEDTLYKLAEEALAVAGILRRQRTGGK